MIQEADTTYEGWANYPTWAVNLWLSNDEGLYDERRIMARLSGPDAGILAGLLKDWVCDELAPDLGASFAADLLGWALGAVDWYEIAAAALEECAGMKPLIATPTDLRVSIQWEAGRRRPVLRMVRENGARCCAEGHTYTEAAASCMAGKYRRARWWSL